MKNTLFIIVLLSSNLTYSTYFSVNVTKKNEQSSYQQKRSSALLDEEDIDFKRQEQFLRNTNNREISLNEWKLFKGLAFLWLGTKCFFTGSKGVMYLALYPDHGISQMLISASAPSLSPLDKFVTKRFIWISLFSTLTAFSGWVLKKSAENLYQGIYDTEDILDFS